LRWAALAVPRTVRACTDDGGLLTTFRTRPAWRPRPAAASIRTWFWGPAVWS